MDPRMISIPSTKPFVNRVATTQTSISTKSTATPSSSTVADDFSRSKLAVTIFYNIYLPPNDTTRGLDIVQEQMVELRRQRPSHSKPSLVNLKSSMVYYVQIGNRKINIDQEIEQCQPCQRLMNVKEGGEMLTLQALHAHCTRVTHQTDQNSIHHRVVYIHNKGSYTATPQNYWMRQLLTKGALSDHCIQRPVLPSFSDSTRNTTNSSDAALSMCNVCSTQFTVVPFHHTIGNMFVADCSYVRHLLPPREYTLEKRRVYENAKKNEFRAWEENRIPLQEDVAMAPLGADNYNTSTLQTPVSVKSYKHSESSTLQWQTERESWMGLGRYAMEHWIHSHPAVIPCDVHRGRPYVYENVKPYHLITQPMKLQLAPTIQWHNLTELLRRKQQHSKRKKPIQYHPWFLLPGRLYEWNELYHSLPPPNSWIWKFYTTNTTITSNATAIRAEIPRQTSKQVNKQNYRDR